MSPIFVAPLWVSCLSAGFPLQRVVWADPVDSSGDAGGAPPRSEQPPHAVPNVALPWPLTLRVTPAGQVTVRLTSSTAKSSMLGWSPRAIDEALLATAVSVTTPSRSKTNAW